MEMYSESEVKEIETEIQRELLDQENWKAWKTVGDILQIATEKTKFPLSDLDELLQEFFRMMEEKRIQTITMPISQPNWFEE